MKNLLCAVFVLVAGVGFSQEEDPLKKIYTLEPRTADCQGAVQLAEKLGPVVGNNKTGKKYEIRKQPEGEENPFIIPWERNVVWYKFTAEKDGELHLMVIPEDPSENFDFMLYEAEGQWFCSELETYLPSPLRSNISATSGITGISDLGTDALTTAESSNPFSTPVKVKNGTTYYFVLDSPAGPNQGHSIEREIK